MKKNTWIVGDDVIGASEFRCAVVDQVIADCVVTVVIAHNAIMVDSAK